MNTYKASEFAKLAGVSVKMLQRWDREGQLKPAARTPGKPMALHPGADDHHTLFFGAFVWFEELAQGSQEGIAK